MDTDIWLKIHASNEYRIVAATRPNSFASVNFKIAARNTKWINNASVAFFTGSITFPIPCKILFVSVDNE